MVPEEVDGGNGRVADRALRSPTIPTAAHAGSNGDEPFASNAATEAESESEPESEPESETKTVASESGSIDARPEPSTEADEDD